MHVRPLRRVSDGDAVAARRVPRVRVPVPVESCVRSRLLAASAHLFSSWTFQVRMLYVHEAGSVLGKVMSKRRAHSVVGHIYIKKLGVIRFLYSKVRGASLLVCSLLGP